MVLILDTLSHFFPPQSIKNRLWTKIYFFSSVSPSLGGKREVLFEIWKRRLNDEQASFTCHASRGLAIPRFIGTQSSNSILRLALVVGGSLIASFSKLVRTRTKKKWAAGSKNRSIFFSEAKQSNDWCVFMSVGGLLSVLGLWEDNLAKCQNFEVSYSL